MQDRLAIEITLLGLRTSRGYSRKTYDKVMGTREVISKMSIPRMKTEIDMLSEYKMNFWHYQRKEVKKSMARL
jgi:hypothetical protein